LKSGDRFKPAATIIVNTITGLSLERIPPFPVTGKKYLARLPDWL
jgi:hypothetical protein